MWKSVFWATVFTLHIKKHHLYQELTVIYLLERKSSSERFSSSPFYKILIGKSLTDYFLSSFHLFFFYLPRYNIIAVALSFHRTSNLANKQDWKGSQSPSLGYTFFWWKLFRLMIAWYGYNWNGPRSHLHTTGWDTIFSHIYLLER